MENQEKKKYEKLNLEIKLKKNLKNLKSLEKFS
jgi:hypothetical protein